MPVWDSFESESVCGVCGRPVITFISEMCSTEKLRRLHGLAKNYANHYPSSGRCRYFYSYNGNHYFDQTGQSNITSHGPTSEELSSIVENTGGMAFTTSTSVLHEPEQGSTRLQIRADVIMTRHCRLFFADFFCRNGLHRVQLVLVPHVKPELRPIISRLLELDINDNSFLYLNSGSVYVTEKWGLWVEIIYSKKVDISRLCREGKASFQLRKPHKSLSFGNTLMNRHTVCYICNPPKDPAEVLKQLQEQYNSVTQTATSSDASLGVRESLELENGTAVYLDVPLSVTDRLKLRNHTTTALDVSLITQERTRRKHPEADVDASVSVSKCTRLENGTVTGVDASVSVNERSRLRNRSATEADVSYFNKESSDTLDPITEEIDKGLAEHWVMNIADTYQIRHAEQSAHFVQDSLTFVSRHSNINRRCILILTCASMFIFGCIYHLLMPCVK